MVIAGALPPHPHRLFAKKSSKTSRINIFTLRQYGDGGRIFMQSLKPVKIIEQIKQ